MYIYLNKQKVVETKEEQIPEGKSTQPVTSQLD